MIYFVFSFPLWLGWLTDEMIQDQQQQNQQVENPKVPPGQQKWPINPPPAPKNRRANLANEPGKTTRGLQTDEPGQQAIYWLSLTDQGQYAASWLAASAFLQDVVTQDQWTAAMNSVRSKLGNVQSRQLQGSKKITQLPHGTRGNFVSVSYQTQFTKTGNSTEVVILSQEGSTGQWKVLSYAIQK